jgi:hypothetical protein
MLGVVVGASCGPAYVLIRLCWHLQKSLMRTETARSPSAVLTSLKQQTTPANGTRLAMGPPLTSIPGFIYHCFVLLKNLRGLQLRSPSGLYADSCAYGFKPETFEIPFWLKGDEPVRGLLHLSHLHIPKLFFATSFQAVCFMVLKASRVIHAVGDLKTQSWG